MICVNKTNVSSGANSENEQSENKGSRKETDGKIIWIDLEMTGLNDQTDVILEIACVVTTGTLEVIAQGPNIVINQPDSLLQKMDKWCTKVHTKSGLIEKVRNSNVTVEQAEQQVLGFLRDHCTEGTSPLGGNSVWMDRVFMMRYMPRLAKFLHYRTIDVSTIKELAKVWYPKSPGLKFKKNNVHRALDDIIESIEELKYYRHHFFKENA